MNRQDLIARMDAILNAAEAEGRGLTTEENAEFDGLKARLAGLDAANETRKGLAALRQQSGLPERVERVALRRDQQLSAIYTRPVGDTRRMGDYVRAQLGIGNIRADQQLGTGSKGGFTAPEHVSAEVLDLARAKSRVVAAGAQTIPIARATTFATLESDADFSNHAENQTITETEMTFGARMFKPYTAVALLRASVELIEDSANFNDVLESAIAAAFATEIDRRSIYGNGIGEQYGLLSDPAITEIDGSTFNTWGPFSRAYQAVKSANYEPGAFITSPGVMGAIDGLVEGGGSNQPLRRPPSLEAAQWLDTTSIPDAGSPTGSAAVTGQWDQYFICTRTPITIEATRTGGDAFSKLSILIRAYARLDSFAVRKSAFAKVTGIPTPVLA